MRWNLKKLLSPRFQCRSIINRVLSLFDRFAAYYNCMTWNVRKLISPPFQCTSNTDRVLSFFHRFKAYYNYMSENSYLLHLSAQLSQIMFLAYLTVLRHYNCMTWNVKKLIFFAISVHKSQIVYIAYLTVLRLITTVWPEMSKNSYLRHFSAQVSQIVFLAYLTVSRLITTV